MARWTDDDENIGVSEDAAGNRILVGVEDDEDED